jgi:hypothetical protein
MLPVLRGTHDHVVPPTGHPERRECVRCQGRVSITLSEQEQKAAGFPNDYLRIDGRLKRTTLILLSPLMTGPMDLLELGSIRVRELAGPSQGREDFEPTAKGVRLSASLQMLYQNQR